MWSDKSRMKVKYYQFNQLLVNSFVKNEIIVGSQGQHCWEVIISPAIHIASAIIPFTSLTLHIALAF